MTDDDAVRRAAVRESLDNVLVARGFATFTVTIRAADRSQAQRVAEAAAGLVRAEFSAITSDVDAYERLPEAVAPEQDALARHLWAEFGTSAPGTHTFGEQDPSVQGWWMSQADSALRAIEEVPDQHSAPTAGCSDHKPVQHRDRKRPWCNFCGRAADGELIGTPR